jgi:hypothetical protein
MRLSEKRQQAVYEAIHGAVTEARLSVIRHQGGMAYSDEKIDAAIVRVTDRAFQAVLRVLGEARHEA